MYTYPTPKLHTSAVHPTPNHFPLISTPVSVLCDMQIAKDSRSSRLQWTALHYGHYTTSYTYACPTMINPHTHTYTHTKTEVAPGYDDVFVQYQAHEKRIPGGTLRSARLFEELLNYLLTVLLRICMSQDGVVVHVVRIDSAYQLCLVYGVCT